MKTVTCSCGYIASGETADALLADVEAHIEAAHSPISTAVGPAAPAPRDVPTITTEAKQ